MFAKPCPWCGKKSSFHDLGSRPAKPAPKWYQFSRKVRVCPHCAGAVKPGGRGLWFVALIAPLLIFTLLELFGIVLLANAPTLSTAVWIMAGVGFLGAYFFSEYQKVENA